MSSRSSRPCTNCAPTCPVECITLTQGSFCGFHWSMIAPLEGWFPDPVVNYDYERRLLQVLQHGAGPTQVGAQDARPPHAASLVVRGLR